MASLRRSRVRAAGDGYFSPAPPRVLAHRGLAIEAPENTLLAFAKALAVGVTHVETDVHVSADGVAMISHDPDLRRLADRRATIDHLTAAELRRIDLGFGQSYCSLAEALDGFPDARFNIDIKIGGAVIPTVEAIRAAGATGRVLIGSFSPARRIAAVRMLPGVATSISARGALGSVVAARSGSLGTRCAASCATSRPCSCPSRCSGCRPSRPGRSPHSTPRASKCTPGPSTIPCRWTGSSRSASTVS